MKLSEWCKTQGITYKTGWNWFKSGKLPVHAYQTETGTILVCIPKVNKEISDIEIDDLYILNHKDYQKIIDTWKPVIENTFKSSYNTEIACLYAHNHSLLEYKIKKDLPNYKSTLPIALNILNKLKLHKTEVYMVDKTYGENYDTNKHNITFDVKELTNIPNNKIYESKILSDIKEEIINKVSKEISINIEPYCVIYLYSLLEDIEIIRHKTENYITSVKVSYRYGGKSLK